MGITVVGSGDCPTCGTPTTLEGWLSVDSMWWLGDSGEEPLSEVRVGSRVGAWAASSLELFPLRAVGRSGPRAAIMAWWDCGTCLEAGRYGGWMRLVLHWDDDAAQGVVTDVSPVPIGFDALWKADTIDEWLLDELLGGSPAAAVRKLIHSVWVYGKPAGEAIARHCAQMVAPLADVAPFQVEGARSGAASGLGPSTVAAHAAMAAIEARGGDERGCADAAAQLLSDLEGWVIGAFDHPILHKERIPLEDAPLDLVARAAPAVQVAWDAVADIRGEQTLRRLIDAYARARRTGLDWTNRVERAVAERADDALIRRLIGRTGDG